MKGQTYVILSIIFIIFISIFAVLNMEVIEVNYVFWRGSSPLIFVILFSVLLGGLLTTVVGSKKYIELKRANKKLEEKVAVFELELKQQQPAIVNDNNEQEDKNE